MLVGARFSEGLPAHGIGDDLVITAFAQNEVDDIELLIFLEVLPKPRWTKKIVPEPPIFDYRIGFSTEVKETYPASHATKAIF